MTAVLQSNKNNNQLTISNLSVSRADLQLFYPVTLTLNSGDSIQVTGGNGAGKTSLLRAVCGLCQSHEGDIEWNGADIRHPESTFNQQLLFIGHALGLKPKLTAEQNLNFYRELRFSPDNELIQSAITQFGIGDFHDELVARMSAGQKRRVALARILTEPVALWVLDEPLAALDVNGQGWLENLCNQHTSRGGMLIITSHQPITGIAGLKELRLA